MSKTLNIFDALLTRCRQLFFMGLFADALVPLTKLWNFRKLPAEVNEEVQSLFAEIYLQQKNYKQARRHLTAAIAIRPSKGEYCYLMAIAIDEDEEADRNRAEMYFARAVQLEPNDTTYLLDFASYLFTIGKEKPALAHLRKAFQLGMADAEIVGRVAEILRREGHHEEAATKLRSALFHNHGKGEFRRVWQQHQFAMIHADQQKIEPKSPGREEPKCVILPFTPRPSQGKYTHLGQKTIRLDAAEPLDEPKRKDPLPERRPPKKG